MCKREKKESGRQKQDEETRERNEMKELEQEFYRIEIYNFFSHAPIFMYRIAKYGREVAFHSVWWCMGQQRRMLQGRSYEGHHGAKHIKL